MTPKQYHENMTSEQRRVKQFNELTEVEFVFTPPVAPQPAAPIISREMMDVFVRELLLDAKKMYDGNVCLKYHTWAHVLDVFSAYTEAFGEATPEIEAAIAFHDVVYIPGASNNMNEVLSAVYLEARFRRQRHFFAAQSDVFNLELACRVIKQTSVTDHLSRRDELLQRCNGWEELAREVSRVCDADLSSLARPWSEFVCNQENIIIEQTGVKRKAITAQHRRQSAEFLSAFLKLETIYYNATAQDLWEDRAWYNIVRWVRENNSGVV